MKDKQTRNQNAAENDLGEECRSKGRWRLVGVVGLLLAATAILTNLRDIKRYIRITTM